MKIKDRNIQEIFEPSGLFFISLMVFAVFVGFAAPFIAPESFFGERMASTSGKIIYIGIVIAIAGISELFLKYLGINLGK